jgi:hypothetical protein
MIDDAKKRAASTVSNLSNRTSDGETQKSPRRFAKQKISRRTATIRVLFANASLPLIGALYSNPVTTARHAHLFDDPLRQATERVGAVITAAGKAEAPKPTPFKRRGA